MNYWFILNLLLLLYAFINVMIVNVFDLHISILGLLGLIFILFNWNMHAIFSKIRNLTSRAKRIKLAKVARKIMPYHLLIGMIGFVFIIFHLTFIVYKFGFAFLLSNYKTISGLVAFFGLLIVIISGYMRQTKATGTRRLIHLYASLTLYFLMLLHIIF